MVEVVSSVWLGTFCIPWPADTRTLVQHLPAPALGPIPCLGVGSPSPALVPSLEIGRLIQGANRLNPTMGRTQILDQRAPNRHPTID